MITLVISTILKFNKFLVKILGIIFYNSKYMQTLKIHKINYSYRRSIALIINPDATLTIKAPHFTPMFFINQLIKEKQDWITSKLHQIMAMPKAEKKQFVNGELFLYLGKHYPLKIAHTDSIKIGEALFFPFKFKVSIQKRILQWYKDNALKQVTVRVKQFAKLMNLEYEDISLSNAKGRWGACTGTNDLSFNWRLIMAPLHIMDYVVVHELAHIKEHNHSKKFWAFVQKYCPDYKIRRTWLKRNGKVLELA